MIKTIVMDLGGVYFEEGTKIALQRIYKTVNVPPERIDEIFRERLGKEGFLYRRGKLTKEEFWNAVVEKFKVDKKMIPELQEIWHSSYTPIKGMKELVRGLRKNYKVIVFSGNIKERVEYLNKKYGLKKEFDDFIFSFETGFHKRETEFYKVLLDRVGCKPEECVFIDDIQEFLDIAKPFGIKTILFQNPEQLKNDLREFGIQI